MKDEVLSIICTRNNPVLLQNLIASMTKHSAGYPQHLVIADNSSTNPKQLEYLKTLSNNGYDVRTYENDRVEGTFDRVSQEHIDEYKYFFFMHDDTFMHKDNWLKVFVDRVNSGYIEPEISHTHFLRYPVGRVASCHQPWRDFFKCKGFDLYAVFLKDALEVYGEDLLIFKYADQDRSLWTQECLKASNGLWSLKKFNDIKGTELYEKVCEALNKTLQYEDEGIPPLDKYPQGQNWRKLTLLTEFMNSAWPLVKHYRTVGLEGNGYLEQIDGFDKPFGNDYVAHLGAPHTKKFFASQLNCTAEDVHKKLYSNDLSFIVKCNNMIKKYYRI